MDDDFSLFFLLFKDPQDWLPDEVEAACQSFMQACDDEHRSAGRVLTIRLWQYWFLSRQEKPLMGDPKYNMALMLNALAFGEFVPPPGDVEFFGRYRKRYVDMEANLVPTPHTWGPRASINSVSGPTLNSAITHAYIFQENQQVSEILLVGQSPPELQEEIFQAVFSCALRVQAGDLDMLNTDIYRIVASHNDQKLFELPGVTMLGASSVLASPNNQSIADALRELIQKLRLLQKQTDLVMIHQVDASVKRDFDGAIRRYARETFQDQIVTIIAKNPVNSPQFANLTTLVPFYQIARPPSPLRVTLHPDILNLASFEELLTIFTLRTVERIRADAAIRQETYETHLKKLKEEQERWNNADYGTRKELWDETVQIDKKFDAETGTFIYLTSPTSIPTTEYMERNVPALIDNYGAWAKRMHQIVLEVEQATARPDTPIRRLAAARFLDAALRERGMFIGDDTIRKSFERFSAQVGPFLRLQWRIALEAKGIDPADVFMPHTVFHTRFRVDEDGEIIGLVMQPFSLISPVHTVLVFDPENATLKTHMPSDYARPYSAETAYDSDELWQELEQFATKSGISQEDFTTKLHSILAKAPSDLLPRIVDYLRPYESPDIEAQWSRDRLTKERDELLKQIHLIRFPSTMNTLIAQDAFHAARKLIQDAQVPSNLQVRLALWQLIVECFALGLNPTEVIPSLAQDLSYPTELMTLETANELSQLLDKARWLDGGFVEEWLGKLKGTYNLQPAVRFLNRDWTNYEQILSTPQRLALYKAQVALASASLARSLEAAAKTITSEGEHKSSLLAKLGQPLAELLLTEIGVTPFSEVLALLEILVGEEKTSL